MRVVVIGAGATGQATAYLLARNGVDVTVVEAAPRPGGLLATFDVGGGHRLEYFYHHFFTHDSEINWLLSELGLQERAVFRPSTMGMYRGGKIYPFNGVKDLLRFRAIPLWGRLRFGTSSAMLIYGPGYAEMETQPAMSWFRRWAGKAATEAIWAPMLRVKFGQAAERVPLAWMAGRLRQRARSRKGTEERLGYLDGSLQVLVDRLVEDLERRSVALQLDTRLERFLTRGNAVVGVATSRGVLEADAVVSTLPTPTLVDFVRELNPDYADRLAEIKYMGAICTLLSLKEQLSPVYWLNVADPGYDFGGVIEQTNLVPPSEYGGQHLVYLSRYLDWDHELWNMKDQPLLDRQLDQLERMFGRNVRGLLNRYWVFRGRFAAPVTDIGFHERIPAFRSPIPNLYVGSMPHVYPDERSVNNSIRVAAELVACMGFQTNVVPRSISLAAKYGGQTR